MVYTGILRKKSDILPLWKYRYFILTSQHELEYYEYEEPLRGIIPLTKTTKIREYPFSMMENTFQIKDKRIKLEIYLWAESYEMMIGWMNALKGSIERMKENGQKDNITSHISSSTVNISPSYSPSPQQVGITSSPVPLTPPPAASPSTSNQRSPTSGSSPTKIIKPLPHSLSSPSLHKQHQHHITGECQCHAIKFVLHSPTPVAQAFCHCKDCQQSSLSPFTCLVIFPSESVEILKGNVFLGKFELTYRRYRYFCRQCASYLFFDSSYQFPSIPSSSSKALSQNRSPSSFLPTTPYTAILSGSLNNHFFEPTCHLMYSSHVMPMNDHLPKYQTIPPTWGGTDPSEFCVN